MLIPVEKIRRSCVLLSTDKERMASFSFIVKKGEYIDVYLQLIFVKMDILWTYRVWKIGELIILELLFWVMSWTVSIIKIARWVKNHSIA